MRDIIRAMPAQHRDVVRLAAATGYRIGDVCNARMRDFDPDEGTLTIIEQKTGKERTVGIAMGSDAWNIISRHNNIRSPQREYLIEPEYGKKANRKTIWYWMNKASKWTGVSDEVTLSPHSLRKHYAVNQRLQGRSLQDVQYDLNHDRAETTILYYYADMLSGAPETYKPTQDIFAQDD